MVNIPNSPKEFFDLLVRKSEEGALPARDAEPIGPNSYCRYRTDDGKKCAIGLLIPDDKYDPCFEAFGGLGLEPNHPVIALLPTWLSAEQAEEVQSAHDTIAPRWNHDEWVKRLKTIPLFEGCW